MTPTTGTALLTHADHLTRQLRASTEPVTPDQWRRFEAASRRLLLELLGPHANRLPQGAPQRSAARRAVDLYPASDPSPVSGTRDRGPEEVPWDEQVGIHQLAVALGALADLVNAHHHDLTPPLNSQQRVDAAAHLLALTTTIARHTLAHGDLAHAHEPLTIARHTESALDNLQRTAGLMQSSVPALDLTTIPASRSSVTDDLAISVHAWEHAVARELDRRIPSLDSIRSLPNQSAYLNGQIADIGTQTGLLDEHEQAALVKKAQLADAIKETWPRGITTLTKPDHSFVTASRDLFETSQRVRSGVVARDTALDAEHALSLLAHAAAISEHHVQNLPHRLRSLTNSGLVFAPARALEPHPDRLTARTKGRYVALVMQDLRPSLDAIEAASFHIHQRNSTERIPARSPQLPSQIATPAIA